ncbi:hypothetical protein IFR05_004105 [Cadophora sp. M221]|nr:hypothetical protein IFR05_004105 [Cadophora sp. M221]
MDSTPPIHNSGSTGAYLSIPVEELMQLRLVALGTQVPSLIIRGAKILALHTGQLLERDVVINGRHIAAITPWNHFSDAKKEINATSKFVSPGFIDAHIHVEYTKLVSGELARLSVPRATLGESNPFSLDLASAQKQAAALHAGKRITGHSALLVNEPLWAYAAGGIDDDHNVHQPHNVVERLRLGMMLTVMSGSMNSNIESVFSDIPLLKDGLGHVSFCADDKLAEDLDSEGHIDHHVRIAIGLGVKPMAAYKMATLNAAAYYPNGVLVAESNQALFNNSDDIPEFALNSIHINPCFQDASAFRVEPKEGKKQAWVQAMEMYDGYFKRAFHTLLPLSSSGSIEGDTSIDVLKVIVIDRHHGTNNCGIGFVRGFGLEQGAIACTSNCENQNLVVIGTSDREIAGAVRAIAALGGGFAAVLDGKLLGSVRLDVAGCMASGTWECVRDDSIACDEAATTLGCKVKSPFMIMSFVGLVAVPDLGLTEMGLVDCKTQGLMDVVLQDHMEAETVLDTKQRSPVRVCYRCPSHAHEVHKMISATVAQQSLPSSLSMY